MPGGQARSARGGGGLRVPLLFALALLVVGVTGVAHGPMVNNGDFWRAAAPAGIAPGMWEPLDARYPIGTAEGAGQGTLGWLVAGLAAAHRGLGLDAFELGSLWLVFTGVFLAGVLRLSLDRDSSRGTPLAAASLAIFALYGFYFQSLFEEAVVLAALPWLLAGLVRARDGGGTRLLLATGAAVLASKVQMVFLLPVLAYGLLTTPTRGRVRKALGLFLLAGAAALSLQALSNAGLAPSNAYNRFFNGVGWTLQGVADWPTANFTERYRYFQANQAALQQRSAAWEPVPGQRFLGTSYWPEGAALGSGEAEDRALHDRLVALGAPARLAAWLAERPAAAGAYLASVYRITWAADHRLDYVRTRPRGDHLVPAAFTDATDAVMRHLGVLFLAGGALLAVLARGTGRRVLVVYWVLGAPLFAVLGDGFFELERHLAPYLMLAPFIAALALGRKPSTG